MEFKGMLRRIAGAGVALAAVGATLMAPVSASAAPAPQDEFAITAAYTIKHPNSNNCLDANDAREVFLAPCDGTASQQWDNYTSGRFRNTWYQLCLASNGSAVFIMDCGTPSGTWTTSTGATKLLRHGVETSMCVTTKSSVAGRYAYMINCPEAVRWVIG